MLNSNKAGFFDRKENPFATMNDPSGFNNEDNNPEISSQEAAEKAAHEAHQLHQSFSIVAGKLPPSEKSQEAQNVFGELSTRLESIEQTITQRRNASGVLEPEASEVHHTSSPINRP